MLVANYGCDARPLLPKVINGTAYEAVTLDISDCKLLVVPETADVRNGSQTDYIEIHMKKELDFHGHPPYPMHIEKARSLFGCAYRKEDGTLLLATYGEWLSMEGGAGIEVLVIVPRTTTVVRQANLSGEDSIAKAVTPLSWADCVDRYELKKCYWYTSTSPESGWTKTENKVVKLEIAKTHR